MHHTPLVSVIVIFFNAEQFFDDAIQSVFDQQYRNWELLLVDDGSSDASTGLAVDLGKRFPGQVRYVEHAAHANRGMSTSRNLGLQHARGEYIAFLDADDVWMPDKLSEQVSVLETHPQAGMTYGRALIWSSWSSAEAADYMFPLGVQGGSLIAPPDLLPNLLRNKVQTPMTSNAMLRRSVIQRVGGFEEEFTAMYEDQVFFSKVEMHTFVYVSGSCYAKYRQHPGSCSAVSVRAGSYLSQRQPFLQWLCGYLDSLEIPAETPVRRALDRELWPYRHPRVNALLSAFVELIGKAKAFVANRRLV